MMSESGAQAHPAAHYGVYVKAWGALLVLTILMVMFAKPAFLIFGMSVKALIICLWFMHLRYERLDFVLYVLLCMFLTALVLFGLIAPDGLAM